MNIHHEEILFCFNLAYTTLSLFTYSVSDEKVKKLKTGFTTMLRTRANIFFLVRIDEITILILSNDGL